MLLCDCSIPKPITKCWGDCTTMEHMVFLWTGCFRIKLNVKRKTWMAPAASTIFYFLSYYTAYLTPRRGQSLCEKPYKWLKWWQINVISHNCTFKGIPLSTDMSNSVLLNLLITVFTWLSYTSDEYNGNQWGVTHLGAAPRLQPWQTMDARSSWCDNVMNASTN